LVETIKGLFFKLLKTQAMKLLISAGLKMTGPIGVFVSFAIGKFSEYAWKILYKLGMKAKNSIETKVKVKEELKEYQEKINDEKSSAEDIKNSGRDFLTK
jgi:hypothetical protein